MKLIMENWRRFLISEKMKTPEDLKDLKHEDGEHLWVISHEGKRFTEFFITTEDHPSEPLLGGISVTKPDDGNCGGAWMVGMVQAQEGWGPFLYDIAMEWTTINGGGLMPNRKEVSSEARRVWDFYLNNRDDVESHQLDKEGGELTDDPSDDCGQFSAGMDDMERITDWAASSLSKRYTKSPPSVIEQVKSNGSWMKWK